MFGQATIPDPRTALDLTPAAPNPLQRLRLAEALYYPSKYYRDSESTFPATFDQLIGEYQARYYDLGDYLLARRARPTARAGERVRGAAVCPPERRAGRGPAPLAGGRPAHPQRSPCNRVAAGLLRPEPGAGAGAEYPY